MVGHDQKGPLLQFAPMQSSVDEGFWHRLTSLKLNKLGIDDSPIPITGFYAPCSHSQVSNQLTLLAESLPSELSEPSLTAESSRGNRNRCFVPGILYNTNTVESFHALDKQNLLKEEARKIWDDIQTGKAVEDCSGLSRFLLISFPDLEKWSFHYWFAFPALILDPPAIVVNLKPASQLLSTEQAESLSAACNKWRSSKSTADVPFFLVCIDPNARTTISLLKDWESCQSDANKREPWFADMVLSLVGEALITVPQGGETLCLTQLGGNLTRREKYLGVLALLNPWIQPDLNLKLMTWRALPSLNLGSLSSVKCLLLGAGTLGCQVARMLMAWGVRKITLLDNGRVAMSNPLRQSLYTLDDCLNGGNFKAMAAVKSLKQIFPAVEVEGIVMAIPMPGHPVLSQEQDSVLDDCRRLSNLINDHDAVFLLTDTRESRWLPTLLCANTNKITITAALGFDSFLVMRHGAGPFSHAHDINARTANALSADMHKLCINDVNKKHRIFAEDEINSSVSGATEQPLGILPHQIRGSLSQFSQMTLVGHSSSSCTACCYMVVSEYRNKGMEFILQAINHPTYLEDLTGLTELMKSAASISLEWDREIDDNDYENCVEI